ncbi:hypothetical protein [Mesorhizobium retamae]|uniref:Uncharacterized protein n=1 Tax=Mesorhizobium retamae TaxID=2912854 RepID=A0ABS9Q9H5_9HYPH|nr:hypothetical protein [Mesorhizobium sp. IRAMC:0171]MCG7504067.1 hypothetical protein [Mesorhizobium sp. IRAMC:0171]
MPKQSVQAGVKVSQGYPRLPHEGASQGLVSSKTSDLSPGLPGKRKHQKEITMNKHINPQDLQTSSRDLILILADELSVLEQRYSALEEAAIKKDAPSFHENYRKAEQVDFLDRIEAIKEAMSSVEATSIKAAVIQLAVANTIVSDMVGFDLPDAEIGKLERTFRRLMHSAMGVLMRDAGLDRMSFGIDRLMSFHLNPWEAYEDRVAALGDL